MKDAKYIIIFILLALCIILSFFTFKKVEGIIDSVRIEILIDSLNLENEKLLGEINLRTIENINYSKLNDSLISVNNSLQKLKVPIIKIIVKYENFKSPSYVASSDTMRSILTENNIK